MTSQAENSKDRLWVSLINRSRKGATYFLELEDILLATPAGYFESRDMDASNQKAIVDEWKEWMATFRCSRNRVLVGLARKQHKLAAAVSMYLLNQVLVTRKLDMMEASKAQLRDNETEMTQLLKKVSLPVHGLSPSHLPLSLNQKGKRPKRRRELPPVPIDEQGTTSSTTDKATPPQSITNEDMNEPEEVATPASPQATASLEVSSSLSKAATMALKKGLAATSSEISCPSPKEAAEENTNIIDESEQAELLAHIEQASHSECEWKIDDICVACSFQQYQKACVAALVERKIKRSEIADIMATMGIFAPFLPTERMIASIGRAILEEIVVPIVLPDLLLDDTAILTAVRLWINNKQDEASDAIRDLDRHTRNMIESLFERLPLKQDRSISESTFVVNYVSPVLHGTLKLDPRSYSVHFPNTCSEVQKQQGLKPDRPDIVVKARNREIMYGEVTGLGQEHNTWKNDWDLFRLARFGKAFLDDGFEVAPLVQVVFSNATYMRLTVGARGMYLLQEVGTFVIPTMVSMIPALFATLPTLLVAQADLKRCSGEPGNRKRSWGFKDIQDAKKRLVV